MTPKSQTPRVYYKVKGASGKDEVQVSSGGLKNGYIFRVKILVKYLTEKYGEPKKLPPSDYKRWLNGKKGIIVFEVSGWDDATGHADLWNGKECVGTDYGGEANLVLFWEAL